MKQGRGISSLFTTGPQTRVSSFSRGCRVLPSRAVLEVVWRQFEQPISLNRPDTRDAGATGGCGRVLRGGTARRLMLPGICGEVDAGEEDPLGPGHCPAVQNAARVQTEGVVSANRQEVTARGSQTRHLRGKRTRGAH